MLNPRIEDLLKKYDVKLKSLGYEPQEMKDRGDRYMLLCHLRWMIKRMLGSEWTSDEIKQNRWLGYIQGVLSVTGVYGILDLRDHTRPLYNLELPLWSPTEKASL